MKTFPIHPIEFSQDGVDAGSTCSSSALIALQILDDSMAPEFTPGQIVVVDNNARLYNGVFVVVQIGEDWLIRRWQPCSDETVLLEALSDRVDSVRVEASSVNVKGVVVQKAGRRRKDRRHYRPLPN